MNKLLIVVSSILFLSSLANSFQTKLVSKATKVPMAKREISMKATTEKKPWELGRFFKTLVFYDALPVVPTIKKLFSGGSKASQSLKSLTKGFVLWSPTKKGILQFGPLDDVVMGGASKSDLAPGTEFDGKWTGFTTSANSGGFAGIRCKLLDPPLDATQCTGIEIKLTGDGQRYKFIARDDTDWNGIAWSYSFDTKANKPIKVQIPFQKLRPTRFAKTMPGITSFNKKTLRGIQLSLSKFEYDGGFNPLFTEGSFSLIVDEIKTY